MIITTTDQTDYIRQLPVRPSGAPKEVEPFDDEALQAARERTANRLEAAKRAMGDRYILRGYNPAIRVVEPATE